MPLPKLIVPPCQHGVGDALPIADDGNEAADEQMHEGGGEDLDGADFFAGETDAAAICEGGSGIRDGPWFAGFRNDVLFQRILGHAGCGLVSPQLRGYF